jgi:hypothetical protein
MTARFTIGIVCLTLALSSISVAAQTRPQPATVAPPAAPAAPAPPAKTAAVAPPAKPGQLVNMKIDFTITDQSKERSGAKRTVSLIVADRENGQVRSEPDSIQGMGSYQLNVDAHPTLVGNKIRLGFSLQYSAPIDGEDEKPTGRGVVPRRTNLRESLSLILDDGKSLVVAQSAEPNTDRIVTLEVKASILK